MKIWSYPKVYSLGHPALTYLFSGSVIVQEKVDGSQFSFGLFDGVFCARSRSADVFIESGGMFEAGASAVSALPLREGLVYRGEYLAKPKHNVLAYSRTPRDHVILYDIERAPNDFLSYGEVVLEADRLGLECVPCFTVNLLSPDDVAAVLDTASCLGGPHLEGIVVKNYRAFGPDGKILVGKYVSEAFKEKHRTDWKTANPKRTDVIALLGIEFRTEARWNKAVQHLKDCNAWTGEPKDIGLLIREVQNDIKDEEREDISARLFQHFWPQLQRMVVAGLPEWYKRKLLES